jgi:hypothetical protein
MLELDVYKNLFKYVCDVNYYEITEPTTYLNHTYKLLEIISLITGFGEKELNQPRALIANSLYVFFKTGLKLFEIFNNICSNNILRQPGVLNKLIFSIILIFDIYKNIYKNKIIKDIYPEVCMKYSILIFELLKVSTDLNHGIYTKIYRPDLAYTIINNVYKSILYHLDTHSIYLLDIKDIIINNMENFPILSENNRINIINKLIEINKIEYSSEFLDPLCNTEIINPVKIPDIDEIFDKSSILTHIYDSKQNPYTRNLLTVDILEEYNNRENIKNQIDDFIKRKKDFENNYLNNTSY